jgi:pseudaminic acid cytidylyltransferase
VKSGQETTPRNIAIIPARGGSKRIPGKNIKDFCGKPIIAWSIGAALAAKAFDAVLVSTDDEKIAATAEANGAEAPFRRPPELANDHALTLPVVAHAIRWFEQNRGPVNFACCIYATAPFLQARFLDEGFNLLEKNPDAEFAFSVTSYAFTIFRSLKRNIDGSMSMFWPENELTRSQDLPEAWHDAGQFYWGRKDAFLTHLGVFSARSYPVVLPRHLVQDLDTPEDWTVAEGLFRTWCPSRA